jgi:ribonucleoside-diphosphate reductase beta chain
LWEKAKRLGVWNPADVDLTSDREDWRRLSPREREMLLRLTALFQGGEESVAIDLLPLLEVAASEGRLEDEMFLAAFLFEEAKHVDAFRRFLDEVAEDRSDLARFHGPSYRRIFEEELPGAMERLRRDRSPEAQAEASVTYNLIVEGMLAETGYHGYFEVLRGRGICPGMQSMVALLQRDESRHLAFGVYRLARLTAEHGDPVWRAIERRMDRLVEPALGVIQEIFEPYGDDVPFGLSAEAFLAYGMEQYRRRLERIERARSEPEAPFED